MKSIGIIQLMPSKNYLHVKWEGEGSVKISDAAGSVVVNKEMLENLLGMLSVGDDSELH